MPTRVKSDTPNATVKALVNAYNKLQADMAALVTSYNAVLTKLDSDAGVTDTNYNSTRAYTVTSDSLTLVNN